MAGRNAGTILRFPRRANSGLASLAAAVRQLAAALTKVVVPDLDGSSRTVAVAPVRVRVARAEGRGTIEEGRDECGYGR